MLCREVLVGLRAEKPRGSGLTVLHVLAQRCRGKSEYMSPEIKLEMSRNGIKTSSGFTFMKFQTLKEIGQSELSPRKPCSDSRDSRNCRFSLDK